MDEKEKLKLDKLNARYKKQNEAIKEKYDRASVTLPKGTLDRIRETGESVNKYINRLVLADLDRIEQKTGPETAAQLPDPDDDRAPFL